MAAIGSLAASGLPAELEPWTPLLCLSSVGLKSNYLVGRGVLVSRLEKVLVIISISRLYIFCCELKAATPTSCPTGIPAICYLKGCFCTCLSLPVWEKTRDCPDLQMWGHPALKSQVVEYNNQWIFLSRLTWYTWYNMLCCSCLLCFWQLNSCSEGSNKTNWICWLSLGLNKEAATD